MINQIFFLFKSKNLNFNNQFNQINILVQEELGDNFVFYQIGSFLTKKYKVNLISCSNFFVNLFQENENIKIYSIENFDKNIFENSYNIVTNLTNKISNFLKENKIDFHTIVFNQNLSFFKKIILKILKIINFQFSYFDKNNHISDICQLFGLNYVFDKNKITIQNTNTYNLFLFSKQEHKNLNQGNIKELVWLLYEKYHLIPVLFAEKTMNIETLESLNIPMINLMGKTSNINTLIKEVSKNTFSIGADTGLTHLSFYCSLPTICIKNHYFKNLIWPWPNSKVLILQENESNLKNSDSVIEYLKVHKIIK